MRRPCSLILGMLMLAACGGELAQQPSEGDGGAAGEQPMGGSGGSGTGGDDAACENSGPELCDGVDNDCDAATTDGADEEGLGQPCDGDDSDLCREGKVACVDGALSCEGDTGDDVELCDGIDNDCDPLTPDGSAEPTFGDACDGSDPDACVDDSIGCFGGVLQCSGDVTAVPDLCDGIDNDCDPSTPDGSGDPVLGAPCDGPDDDLCGEGVVGCAGGMLVCSDNTGNNLELCDGQDNDCNPLTVDGSGDPMLGAACDGPDGDLCLEGTFSCGSGSLTCSDTTGTTPDVCDGVDNDCNPATVDGLNDPLYGTPCDGPDADFCTEGTLVCVSATLSCNDNTGDALELCDGIDNDCNPTTVDGSGDPALGSPCDGPDVDTCTNGVSVCSGGGLSCTNDHSHLVSVIPSSVYSVSYHDTLICAQGAELHVFSVYEAAASCGSNCPADVYINRSKAPVIIVLSGFEAVQWTLHIDPAATVQQIITTGTQAPTVQGAGSVPVVHQSWGFAGINWGSTSVTNFVSNAESFTGSSLTSYAGCYRSNSYTLSDFP